MWIEYNPNPTGRNVDDCAVRAVSKALNTDWETADDPATEPTPLIEVQNSNLVINRIA